MVKQGPQFLWDSGTGGPPFTSREWLLRDCYWLLRLPHEGMAINEAFSGDGAVIYKHACALGCEGIVSKRLGSPYRAGRSAHWLKTKNPASPAVKREAEEE